MKKILFGLIALCAVGAYAADFVDNFTFTKVAVTNDSHYAEQMVRGMLEGVYLDMQANKTNGVYITVDGQTIWTNTATADGYYPIRVPTYTTAGAALTETHNYANPGAAYSYGVLTNTHSYVVGGDGAATNSFTTLVTYPIVTPALTTNSYTVPIYGKFPLAGKVRITISPHAATTGTNTNSVKLMFSR